MPAQLTRPQQELLDAIRRVAEADKYQTAAGWDVDRDLGRRVRHEEYRALVEAGRLAARQATSRKTGNPFLVWRLRPADVAPFPCTDEAAREHIAAVLEAVRGPDGPARYTDVRDRFLWFDWRGTDLFEPVARRLAGPDGPCRFSDDGRHFDLAWEFVRGPLPVLPEPPDPSEADFVVLNALEAEETRRINFGATETVVDPAWLAQALNRPPDDVRAALDRLAGHHDLMWLGGGVRSRMAELAREVRYVKQRFSAADAGHRPYVVRAIQVRAVPRTRPARDQALAPVVAELRDRLAGIPHASTALEAMRRMAEAEWGTPAMLAGFQLRALAALLPAYLGVDAADAFVVTADTGSGKTEAALLPLLAGALADRLAGRRGVKAVLVYPRVRLAYNQAQRLVRYLARLAGQPGVPTLTVGVQSKDVPRDSSAPAGPGDGDPWPAVAGGFAFPLFTCPACDGPLVFAPHGGRDGHDRLTCPACGWSFAGWAGSKRTVRQHPPDFFLPVTESLHQWLHDPAAGRLFGDRDGFLPPRALVADEVHLYSHIQGAQVGYALRRLLARAELNARFGEARPLAVGMSATLGRPAEAWGRLIGRTEVGEIAPVPAEVSVNPRGREYFYFVQPEVESHGRLVAGGTATIQALMCLAHGMRRRPGDRGGYRGLVFFDSIDSLKQLHHDYTSAEGQNRLAALRTRTFPADGGPGAHCCGRPGECERFRFGECWYFAAAAPGADPARPNDPCQVAAGPGGPVGQAPGRPLTVMPRPVYSGAGGRVDEELRRADLVFATSSLEVGFDDPDMILVYQHYAPGNLASFIQRKGRGGRGADDRPVTGCTLSVYSPRDSWYFRHPDLLLGGEFDVPLNPENYFVRRGQAAAALLDALARALGQAGANRLPDTDRSGQARMADALAAGLDDADRLLRLTFGDGVYADLRVSGPAEFWERVSSARPPEMASAGSWRAFLPWVPGRLFDAINLPLLRVAYATDGGKDREDPLDVSLAFGLCAPGSATRRFGFHAVHWVPPPAAGVGPMFPPDACASFDDLDLVDADRRAALGNTPAALDRHLRDQLPDEAVARLPAGRPLYHALLRPRRVRLPELGRFVPRRGLTPTWQAAFVWDPTAGRVVPAAGAPVGAVPVHHKTSATLLGFPLVRVTREGRRHPIQGLTRLALDLRGFVGGPQADADTGLCVSRAFWGVDVGLRLGDRGEDEETWTTVFTHPDGDGPCLYGYQVVTEGVRLTPDRARLDEFVAAELVRVKADSRRDRWHRGQLFRHLLASRLTAAGLSGYAAGPLADLVIAAGADESLAPRLERLFRAFDPDRFAELLAEAYRRRLEFNPVLSEERVRQLGEDARGVPNFGDILRRSVADVKDDGRFAGYLRSVVLHGLVLGLHGLFVIHGRGEERQVLAHARLPVQFGGRADDHLTVFESGDHGDGTARTFLNHLPEAFAGWRRGELAGCPYAAEEALLDQLFEHPDRHAGWRRLDPAEPDTLRRIGRELTGTAAVSELHLQALGRAMFQREAVGGRVFDRYDLVREVRAVRDRLAGGRRRPTAWELVTAAVRAAAGNDPVTPTLAALLETYRTVSPVAEGSLRAEARLAEQVYRLGAAVCPDGCRACLHRSSPLMPDALAATAVSRDVLAGYREFVLEPGTVRVGDGRGPGEIEVEDLVRREGLCRLLVDPAVNDGLAGELACRGFTGGEYDPLLRRVVWMREG